MEKRKKKLQLFKPGAQLSIVKLFGPKALILRNLLNFRQSTGLNTSCFFITQETTDGAGSSIQQQQHLQQQQQQQRMSSAGLANANSASAISLASTPGGATTPPVSTVSHSRLSILSRWELTIPCQRSGKCSI